MNDTSLATRRKRLLLDLLIMASLTGITAWVSLVIARIPGGMAAVWVSNGIWAGWLLSRRTAAWPGYTWSWAWPACWPRATWPATAC